jgi:hypothetical protein
MSEYLVEIVCTECGNEEYFEIDNLPGGAEHCPYCSECSALLPVLPTMLVPDKGQAVVVKDESGSAPCG